MPLSPEKRQIIANIMYQRTADHEGSRIFRVVAGAGAGKSVLITELARLAADRSLLFLSKSRNIADRARLSLPQSVRVQTLYGQALSFIRHRFRDKIRRQGGQMRMQIPIPAILDAGYVETSREAHAARAAVEAWIFSTRPIPDEGDIPASMLNDLGKEARRRVASGARAVATSQGNPNTDTIPLTYDFVIREWASAHGKIRVSQGSGDEMEEIDPLSGANLVILEEGQDCPAIVYSFLRRQRVDILILGDPYQSLLAADTAHPAETCPLLDDSDGNPNMILEESYRFGPPVASLLNALTHYVAGDANRDRIMGLGHSSVFTPDRRQHLEQMGFHYTVVARSITTVLREAVQLGCRGAELAWVDGIGSYSIEIFRDLMAIGMREIGVVTDAEPVYRRDLANFGTLAAAHHRYTNHGDRSHAALVELCMELQAQRFNYLEVIDWMILRDRHRQEALLRDWRHAPPRHVTLTTSTRAKGSEFDRVVIADDLVPPGLLKGGTMSPQRKASFHHLYTAISRAKYEVVAPPPLVEWIGKMGFGTSRPPLACNQLSPKDPVETPLWHPQFGPSPQVMLEMVPDNRLRRAEPTQDVFKPQFKGDPAGAVKRAFEEELAKQMEASPSGPSALRTSLRTITGKRSRRTCC